jgi:hypothetical protein
VSYLQLISCKVPVFYNFFFVWCLVHHDKTIICMGKNLERKKKETNAFFLVFIVFVLLFLLFESHTLIFFPFFIFFVLLYIISLSHFLLLSRRVLVPFSFFPFLISHPYFSCIGTSARTTHTHERLPNIIHY